MIDVDTQSETPSLWKTIKVMIDGMLYDVHTCMPGQVVAYNAATQLADIQPVLKKKSFVDDSVYALPVIPEVPVMFPRTANAFVSLPIAAGDYVLLVFTERSIERWLKHGGAVDPQDTRRHDLSDAVAIPGLFPSPNPIAAPGAGSLRIQNGQARIDLDPSGKIQIKNLASGIDLVERLDEILAALDSARTATATGPQPLVPMTGKTWAGLRSDIATEEE